MESRPAEQLVLPFTPNDPAEPEATAIRPRAPRTWPPDAWCGQLPGPPSVAVPVTAVDASRYRQQLAEAFLRPPFVPRAVYDRIDARDVIDYPDGVLHLANGDIPLRAGPAELHGVDRYVSYYACGGALSGSERLISRRAGPIARRIGIRRRRSHHVKLLSTAPST